MTRTLIFSMLTASVLLTAQASAASEQALLVRMPLAACAVPFANGDAPTAAEAADLIRKADARAGGKGEVERGPAYVLHVIDYNDDSSIRQQRWFVYDGRAIKETDRLFGRKHLRIVSVHRGVRGISRADLAGAITAALDNQIAVLAKRLQAAKSAKDASDESIAKKAAADTAAKKALADAESARKADPANAELAAAVAKARGEAKDAADALSDAEDDGSKNAKDIRSIGERKRLLEGVKASDGRLQLLVERAVTGDTVNNGDGLDQLTIAGIGDQALALLDGVLVDENFKPLAELAYRVDVTTKTPAPLDNLKSILGLVQPVGMSAAETLSVALASVNFCALGSATLDRLPADVKVTAVVPEKDKDKALGTKTFDNEGKYWYDFAFALPMTSYSDVTIDSTNATLTAKTVKKSSLFAVASVGLPRDTKRPGWNWPVAIYGLPMSGRAIHHHLTAAAFGFGPVQMFWGYIHNRDQVTASTADAKPDDVLPESVTTSASGGSKDVIRGWSHTRTFGVVIQVSRVIDLFKKK